MTMSLSAVPLPDRCVVVFDLDDTLYAERDFVRSGFRAVARAIERQTGKNYLPVLTEWLEAKQDDPFGRLVADYGLAIDKAALVQTYRNHLPDLKLSEPVARLLDGLRVSGKALGILTDGRSVTQRNKIRALGLERWINTIVISEEFGSSKPDERNYRHFERLYPMRRCVYVGDNLAKDFITPNHLGWQTVCVLDAGRHIHAQEVGNVAQEAMPQYWIERVA
jgi:putative hydrolase of the HAD superfamily